MSEADLRSDGATAGVPGMAGAPARAENAEPRAVPRSIVEFLTDGSLPKLCAELSVLTGVRVELRDPEGRAILPGESRPWEIRDAFPAPGLSFPLRAGETEIGSIVLVGDISAAPARIRQTLERALRLLASAASELCENQGELRHRVKEVGALYRLSSLLVRAASLERVLEVALESALDVLELDAGSLVLLREDADGIVSQTEEDLTLMASRNLSQRWLKHPSALSKDRLFDVMALKGEVVIAEDLRVDPRVQIPELVDSEGLVSFINAGLVFQGRPIGVIRLYSKSPRTFSESDKRLLRSIAQQAAVAVQQTSLLKHREEELRIQRQVQMASDIQRRMLPRTVPSIPGLNLAARCVPSFELGGDFYDFMELSGSLGLVVGDVVGKGIGAALLMSAVRASLRAHTQSLYDLDEVVSRVNVALCRDTQTNEFATLWYGVIDPRSMRLTYCSAGHDPVFVVRVPAHRAPSPADIDELSVGGMVVGVDPSQRYQRAVYDLKPRDAMVMYTDGVTDAINFAGQKYGKKRLRKAVLDILTAEPDATASRILEHVFWDLRQFAGLTNRPDDQTLVVVRVGEPAK